MKTFTIEFNKEDEAIELHLDKAGAEYLKDLLEKLIEHDEQEHYNLMTEEWGGNELSLEKQSKSSTTKLIHHLKLMYWK